MTEEELVTKNTAIRKAAIPSGLILGIISTVLTVFSFYFVTGMTTSMWLMLFSPMIFSIILPLVIAIFFILDLRKKIGGFWSFKQAVSGIFIMLTISAIISTVGGWAFSKTIEPDMMEKTKSAMVTAVTEMMESTGAPQEKIDQSVEDMEKKFDEQKDAGVGSYFKNFAISLIFMFILALIFGAIFKKEPPVYLQFEDEKPVDPAV